MSFLLYGANGYTGKLTAELAVKKGLKPTLAGRKEPDIKKLADELQLPYLIFDLEDENKMVSHLKDFSLVLNTAGPFSITAKPMVNACLKSKTHYLDITGEIEVFEWVKSQGKVAKEVGIILMSGVGFDVVPTDCVADYLKKKMPNANKLQLAFAGLGGSISHGTMTTMLQNLGEAGAERVNHKIERKPIGNKGMEVDFKKMKTFCATIPWGDVSTAHHTTNIPNIETYTTMPKGAYIFMKGQSLFNPILRTNFVKNQLQKWVDKNIDGPSRKQNEKGVSLVWGKVTNNKGNTETINYIGPEGYKLTAETSLVIAQKILNGNHSTGYHTPAGLFGYELLNDIEGCKLI